MVIVLTFLTFFISSSLKANEDISAITFTQKVEDDTRFWDIKELKLKEEGIFNKEIFENSKKAFDTDIGILAKEMNLDFEVVKKSVLFQKAFKKYFKNIKEKYPNKISSFYLERIPKQKGHIQFIGEVPKEVLLPVEKNNQGDKIIITGDGEFTVKESLNRVKEVAKSISKTLQHGSSEVYFSHSDKKIKVNIQQPYGYEKLSHYRGKKLSEDSLLELVQNEFEKNNLKTIRKGHIDFNIYEDSEPIYTPDASRGGSRLLADNREWCTNGWSVIVPGFGLAALTAGHCMDNIGRDVDEIQDHKNGIEYPMNAGNFIFNLDGDIGFNTTPTTQEKYEFHARANEIRYTSGREAIADMVGESVCVYGRTSNSRSCNHEVLNTGVVITYSNGTQVGNLVRVTNNSNTTGGDSGGGWSWGNQAWGVHSGSSSTRAYFTPIERAEEVFDLELF